MRAVFQIRGYRRLLAVYALNESAWSIGLLALSVLVYARTGSALASTGFFLASQFLPAFVLSALVARVDRLPVGRVLAAMYAAQAALFALLAGARSDFALAPVLVLAFVVGAVGLAARPVARATATAILAPDDLVKEGNAIANIVFAACIMAGPVVGGLIVAAGNTAAALLVVAGLFGCAALLCGTAHGLPGHSDHRHREGRRVRAAIAFAARDHVISRLLSFQAIALVFFSVSVPVEVVFAQRSLHAGSGGYGALLSAWGGGAIVGSGLYARWRGLAGWLLIGISSIAMGVGFLVMAGAPTLAVAIIGSAVGGMGNGVEAVAERTVLQERVDPAWLAMTLSLNDTIFQAMPGLGFVIGGAVTALSNPRVALAVGGAGALVVGALAPVVLRGRGAAEGPADGTSREVQAAERR